MRAFRWETSETPIALLPEARSLLLFLRRYFATVYCYELLPVRAIAGAPNSEEFKGKANDRETNRASISNRFRFEVLPAFQNIVHE